MLGPLEKMASKKTHRGGNILTGRHKDICGLLGKRRRVVKHNVSPDSCTEDMQKKYASRWNEQGTVRSPERSSNVPLMTCHTCVGDVNESRDFLSSLINFLF
jgi:hypothetical protein